jgi:hypothetical protein
VDLCRTQGRKRGKLEEAARGTFWRGTALDMDTRLRVGRALAKTEEEVALQLMQQVKRHAPEEPPPAMSTDGKGAYREAMLATWGTVPAYGGRGRPPRVPQPGKDWQYLQVIKRREGSKVVSVTTKVIYGEQEEVKKVLGEHTAYVERTHLTSRQMNGRLVRKTLSFSKELRFLKAASALEDAFYNFTRPLKTLRVEVETPSAYRRWQQRTPAMAAGLTDHIWTVKELLTVVLVRVRFIILHSPLLNRQVSKEGA